MGSIASVLQWHCSECALINPTENARCARCGLTRLRSDERVGGHLDRAAERSGRSARGGRREGDGESSSSSSSTTSGESTPPTPPPRTDRLLAARNVILTETSSLLVGQRDESRRAVTNGWGSRFHPPSPSLLLIPPFSLVARFSSPPLPLVHACSCYASRNRRSLVKLYGDIYDLFGSLLFWYYKCDYPILNMCVMFMFEQWNTIRSCSCI